MGTHHREVLKLIHERLKRQRFLTMFKAKNHEHEAEIIAEAGKKGAVTVATTCSLESI